MATQAQLEALTTYRAAQSAVRAGSLRDMLGLWRLIDWRRLDKTYPDWERAVTTLVHRDEKVLNDLAAAYVREAARAAKDFEAQIEIRAAQINEDALAASLRVTSVARYVDGLRVGKSEEAASAAAQVASAGAATRHALDAGRGTVIDSTVASLGGWARVTSPGACAFCRMLAGRGVHYSANNVRFASHDHCDCSVVSEFGVEGGKVSPTFVPSTRNITDADRARVREWMRKNIDAA